MAGVSRSETRKRTHPAKALARLHEMIRRRWGLAAITVVVMAVTVWECALLMPHDWMEWTLAFFHVLAVACVPFIPVPASAAIIVVGTVSSLGPYQSGPSQLWGAMLALGVIGMMCRLVVSAASCAVVIGTQVVQMFVLHSSVADEQSLPFFALCFVFAVSVGYAVRQQRGIVMNREQQLRTEALLGQVQVALRLHDEVANDLVVAAHFAQRRMHHARDDEERKAWDGENQRILSALSDVHAIIDAAAIDEREEADEPSGAAFEHLLCEALAQERKRLTRAGLNVDMRLSGRIRRSVAPVVRRESLALLHELCRNAVRHSPSGTTFRLSMHCGPAVVEITELCRWETNGGIPNDEETDGQSNGQGLEAHRRMIRGLGGELTWSQDASTWQCYARIPLFAL